MWECPNVNDRMWSHLHSKPEQNNCCLNESDYFVRIFLSLLTHNVIMHFLLTGNSRNRNAHPRQNPRGKKRTRVAAIVWSSEWALSLSLTQLLSQVPASCLTWHPVWMTERCLLHVHDFNRNSCGSYQELLPPLPPDFTSRRNWQRQMLKNTTWPSTIIQFIWESPNTKHCLLNQLNNIIFCILKDFFLPCSDICTFCRDWMRNIYISRMSMRGLLDTSFSSE